MKRLWFYVLALSLLFFTAATATSPAVSSVCSATPQPDLCLSILSAIHPDENDPFNHTRVSIDISLHRARGISDGIRAYPANGRISGAVAECQTLLELNVRYLKFIDQDLKAANNIDSIPKRMNSVIKNHQRCVDRLVVVNGTVMPELTDVSEVYGITLAVVTEELAQNARVHRRQGNHNGEQPAAKVSAPAQPVLSPPTQPPPSSRPPKAPKKTPTKTPTKAPAKTPTKRVDDKTNGVMVKGSVVVSKNGDGNFTTIGQALLVAPVNLRPEDGYFVIFIKEGVYEEYLTIPINLMNIMFVGDGKDATIITGNRNVRDQTSGTWSTYNCSTVAIEGEGFVGIDLAFRNTAGPENDQAVALRNSARHSTFYRCSFEGYQDTLYVQDGYQFYQECDVYGTIDFIFGHATAFFQGCNILARRRPQGYANVIAAQGREDATDFSAIVFQNCTIDRAPDLVADPQPAPMYLGRPWRPYATTVVMESYLGATVAPEGWLEFNGTEGLNTLTYGEYANHGPGADTSKRVHWKGYSVMNAAQAATFTVASIMNAGTWLPPTNVPFTSGL